MNPTINELTDLFFDQLRDIHSVETQVAETLPHLSTLAALPALRDLFAGQRSFTLEQANKVAAIFEANSRKRGSDECLAMKGLIAGGNEHLSRATDPTVRDFMLVAHWLRIKHYEIAAYQIAASLALRLDFVSERELLSNYLAAEERALRELESVAASLLEAESGDFPSSNLASDTL